MKGFFDKKQGQSKSRPSGKSLSCHSCGLHNHVLSPAMKPYGKGKKGILNIGEAPGEMEDRRGKQWQGKVGRKLRSTYRKLGIDLFEDCVNINAINCRPTNNRGNNRPPNANEIAACRRHVLDVINKTKPHVIMLFGGSAVSSFIGYKWKKNLQIARWRGWTIPDQDQQAWVVPVFHPSYIERGEEEVELIWKQDLERGLEKLNEPVPKFKKPKMHFIEDLSVLDDLDTDLAAFDLETTGLKPQEEGHEIICASIAPNNDEVYAFMMPESYEERRPFLRFLDNQNIGKIAANMKHEDHWCNVILGQEVKCWDFDTMLASHVIDNRPLICGLKFQTYVNYGIADYSSEIEPYLHSKDPNNTNSFNRIYDFLKKPGGKEKMLTYVAWDSLHERRLTTYQMEKIDYSFLPF